MHVSSLCLAELGHLLLREAYIRKKRKKFRSFAKVGVPPPQWAKSKVHSGCSSAILQAVRQCRVAGGIALKAVSECPRPY